MPNTWKQNRVSSSTHRLPLSGQLRIAIGGWPPSRKGKKSHQAGPAPNRLHNQGRHNESRIHHPVDRIETKRDNQILVQRTRSPVKKIKQGRKHPGQSQTRNHKQENQTPRTPLAKAIRLTAKGKGQRQNDEDRAKNIDQRIAQSLVKFRIIDRFLEILQPNVSAGRLQELLPSGYANQEKSGSSKEANSQEEPRPVNGSKVRTLWTKINPPKAQSQNKAQSVRDPKGKTGKNLCCLPLIFSRKERKS